MCKFDAHKIHQYLKLDDISYYPYQILTNRVVSSQKHSPEMIKHVNLYGGFNPGYDE